jgi:hypothetical protein
VDRDLGRLYAATGRLTLARAALHDAELTFAALGAVGDAETTRRELREID